MMKSFMPFAPTATDFYKTGHIKQYPKGTGLVYTNFTPRSDAWAKVLPDFDHKIVWCGLQGVCQWMLNDLWNQTFFERPKDEVLKYYKRRMDTALGPDSVNVDHMAQLHDLGYLPVYIKALPEGSRVNIRVPCYTIRNTLSDFYWVTNYLETQLSAETWKMLTSATTAYEYKRLLKKYSEVTGSDKAFIQWQGHDFSYRGLSGIHDAAQSGMGHLLSFTGTDTISAIDYAEDYYSADAEKELIGGSVPATEHSVMCMGSEEGEEETFNRLITEIYPGGIVSIVSDTWDFWHVLTVTASKLKDKIMARNGRLVFRPDSGDPVKIICGDDNAINSAECKGAVECLWDIFGGTTTKEGYKTLDTHVGVIYGDSITLDRAQQILAGLKNKGFSSGNIVFGIGSYTYQQVTRDTFGTAMKATYGIVNDKKIELYKDPKTDSSKTKKSARGLIRVEKDANSNFVMFDQQTWWDERGGLLEPVYENGTMLRMQTLSEIREILERS